MGNHKVLTTLNHGDQVIHASTWIPKPTRSREDFLSTLFSALDSAQVRYCVLPSWEELPQNLSSDLDIAVHPHDDRKLVLVFRLLQKKGYWLAQAINYFVEAYCFRFLWFEGPAINFLAVDVIFKHQRGVLIAPSVKLLVSGRRRHGMFWIPAPESEFTYLLARKMWKGKAPTRQQRRLKVLVEQLGRSTAERLARDLFLGSMNVRVVEACANGHLNPLLAQIKGEAWKTGLVRNPLRSIANLLFDGVRRIRRWSQPEGLFVAVMGPDGAGKSTLIENLVKAFGCAFGCHKLFHWRPMLLWRRNTLCDTTRPHSLPQHSRWWSIARLFAHLLDYWLGYWLVIRPLLARSGLVLFDRYFDDVLIDPKRYRYGGPLWLARIMRLVIPKPNLVLVLDASEEVLLSRKQEVAPEEVRRQRRLYARCTNGSVDTRVISALGSVPHVTAEAATALVEHLSQRFEHQHQASKKRGRRVHGESQDQPFQVSFNRFLRVNFQGSGILSSGFRKLGRRLSHVKEKLAERNSVQRWVSRKMLPLAQALGFSVCGDHFYEPIPNIALIRTTYIEQARALQGFCHDASWTNDATKVLSTYFSEYLSSQAYLKYRGNWYYKGWDAAYYYCLIRSRKPRSITEIGRGFSTWIAEVALQQNARDGHPCEIVSIDPYFRGDCATSSARVITSELQKLDVEQRRSLLCADILFIDSTHMLKWGSDVLHLFESWIPHVPVNTLVHMHDIFTPYDYPKRWMVQAKRFWNEQYILESFLAFNNSFRIFCPIYYLSSMGLFKAVAENMGSTELAGATGAAMWLERIG